MRRFFRLHLSTSIVLMLAAATFVLMNSAAWWGVTDSEWNNPISYNAHSADAPYHCYGFPRAMWTSFVAFQPSIPPLGFQRFIGPDGIQLDLPPANLKIQARRILPPELHIGNVFANVGMTVVVLLAIWAVMEWDIRRQARVRESRVISP